MCKRGWYTVKAHNNALGGNVSKHFGPGRYLRPGCYLGPMDELFHGYVLHNNKKMCTCMHTIQDVRSCEYTQPPRAFTQTWATIRIKRVDMVYLGAYTCGCSMSVAFEISKGKLHSGVTAW